MRALTGLGYTITYTYDAQGQRTRIASDKDGYQADYAYDDAGRLSHVSYGGSGIADYAYSGPVLN